MADDAGPPPRRRLGRRRPTEPVAPRDASSAEPGDAVESADADASYAAAEVDAAAEAAVIEGAIDPSVEPPRRRRLGRRSAIESGQASTAIGADTPGNGRPADPIEPTATWLSMLDDRSANAAVCPFLRAVDDQGVTRRPTEAPDPSNRCAALSESVPQSLRQQELVCLSASHINCPRYLRGVVAASQVPTPAVRAGRAVTPVVLGSIAVLALAFTASIAFVVTRGGLDLTAAVTPQPSASAVAAVPSPDPTPATAPTSATPSVTPSPTASPAPTASPTPAPTPAPTPTPEPTPSPKPTSARYALLEPCPDTPKCWIYTVRRGDNLFSIANYFGVSLQSIYDRNPWARTQSLRAGLELRLPPPTR